MLFRLSFNILMLLTMAIGASGQSYQTLESFSAQQCTVYHSKGFKTRTGQIAPRVDKAMQWYSHELGFKPEVVLLVLSKDDWPKYTKFPVYGMPHYNDDKTLIVAAEDNEFWQSFLPPMNQLPNALADEIMATYRDQNGNITMKPFFDLLALHELGHAYHFQAGLQMQRKWLGELYPNVLLHSYISENESEALPALTLFPKMVINAGTKGFTYTSLQDIEERYEEIGQQHPKNYGWFQCRWHFAAGKIYDTAGKNICLKMWNAFAGQKQLLDDASLQRFLEKQMHPAVADVMRNWDTDMIR